MARLLTADEIRQLPRASVVWIVLRNVKDGYIAEPIPALKCEDGTLVDEEGCFFDDIERDMVPYLNGWAWQFWSDEPTEQQIKDTLRESREVDLNEQGSTN